jgi:uncharacterized membrane protein
MNETDVDRMESKTLNASVIDLQAYREQAELKRAAHRTSDAFAGAAQFGVTSWVVILAVLALVWFFIGRK